MRRRAIGGVFVAQAVRAVFQVLRSLLSAASMGLSALESMLSKYALRPIDQRIAHRVKQSVADAARVDPSAILLTTTEGEYTCNVKYIAEELLRRDLPYELIWSLRGAARGPYPERFTLVEDASLEYFEAAARSKVLIQNGHSLQRNGVVKNDGQYWLQTWHGSLGLKRLEGAGGDPEFYERMRSLQSEQTDLLFSNSQFEEDVFASSYWPGVPARRLGHARNDILISHSDEDRSALRKKVLGRLNVDDIGQYFLLFAPTHDETNPYQPFGNVDFASLVAALSSRFGGNWHILIRTHNRNKRSARQWLAGLPTFCHDASAYPDIQELQVVADAGLTDFSSWICDFILTRRPALLFSPGLREYERRRGFYHDLEDTPFPVALSNAELIEAVRSFDAERYEREIDDFLARCECMDDGLAAQRIVDVIEELMQRPAPH